MAEISRRTLKDLVVAHARSLFPEQDPDTEQWKTTIYKGPPGQDPTYMPVPFDDAGHIRPYVCVYGSPGAPSDDVDLAGLHNDIDWQFQLTAAAAFEDDLDALFDVLIPGFRAWVPTLPDDIADLVNVGRAVQLNVPGRHLIDRSQTPDRPYNVLQYGISATT